MAGCSALPARYSACSIPCPRAAAALERVFRGHRDFRQARPLISQAGSTAAHSMGFRRSIAWATDILRHGFKGGAGTINLVRELSLRRTARSCRNPLSPVRLPNPTTIPRAVRRRSCRRARVPARQARAFPPTRQVSKQPPFWLTFAYDPALGLFPPDFQTGADSRSPSHSPPPTRAVAVGLKAVDWARPEVGGWDYTILSPHPEARGALRGEIGRGVGPLKCNLFVYDALSAAGAAPNRIDGRVPSAAEWGNPGFSEIRDYPPIVTLTIPNGGLDSAMIGALHVGDIISDGKHVGLVSFKDGKPRTISAASPEANPPIGGVTDSDWGFRPGQTVTIRRYRPFGEVSN